MKRIVFFNYYGNGDIHLSRGFVRQIMQKVRQQDANIQFAFGHKKDPKLLSDIEGLDFDPNALSILNNPAANLVNIGDTTYINTWYGQQNYKYIGIYGTTIDCLYAALDDSCKTLWNFSLEDISTDLTTFFPIIDYSKYQIEQASNWLHGNTATKILVENGNCTSSQADNFPIAYPIVNLANKHKDKIFILTQEENISLPSNIAFSSHIIHKRGISDLNEVSFLSTHCDMIIGRASGVFSFTINQDNLFRRQIKFLCFSNFTIYPPNKFWMDKIFQDRVNYNSTITNYKEYNTSKVEAIIEDHINKGK